MGRNMKVNGNRTKNMEKGSMNGLMGHSMKENISSGKGMEEAEWFIKIMRPTMENGRMETNMDEVSSLLRNNIFMEFGKKEN